MFPEDLGVIRDLMPVPTDIRIILTLLVVLGFLLLRWGVLRIIRAGSDVLSDTQRWWMAVTRNLSGLMILISVIAIWAPEIEAFALSITAIAVAVAIALKELILCISGATWRGATGAFGIGDWIEIGEHSGEVIDENLMVTVLQEIEPREYRYTGRTIAVPNALLLSHPVINHNFRKRFLHHEFWLYTEPNPDAREVRDAIQTALATAAEEFAEIAHRYASVIEKRAGLRLPEVSPKVCLQTTESAKIAYRCALFCPREQAGAIEQIAAHALLEAGGVHPVGK